MFAKGCGRCCLTHLYPTKFSPIAKSQFEFITTSNITEYFYLGNFILQLLRILLHPSPHLLRKNYPFCEQNLNITRTTSEELHQNPQFEP
jgi:hypothetical protein